MNKRELIDLGKKLEQMSWIPDEANIVSERGEHEPGEGQKQVLEHVFAKWGVSKVEL